MDYFDKLLYETSFSTKDTAKRVSLRYSSESLSEIMNLKEQETDRLRRKYFSTNLTDNEVMKKELEEYLAIIVDLINQEYAQYIPLDRLKKLNDMCNGSSIVVINDSKDKHDISALEESGKVIVNLENIGKTKENPNPDIFTKIACAKGSLPHELFHIIINMLKPSELADERMVISLVDGEEIRSLGMVGFMLNEGFVEKISTELCEKYNLYYLMAPQYIPYVDICDYIMSLKPLINAKTCFSLDASEVLSSLNMQQLEHYYRAEAISFAVRHKAKSCEEVNSSRIEKVLIDFNSISDKRKKELKEYYDYKNAKLEEILQIQYKDVTL